MSSYNLIPFFSFFFTKCLYVHLPSPLLLLLLFNIFRFENICFNFDRNVKCKKKKRIGGDCCETERKKENRKIRILTALIKIFFFSVLFSYFFCLVFFENLEFTPSSSSSNMATTTRILWVIIRSFFLTICDVRI